MTVATLLLPATARLGGPLPAEVATMLGRADRIDSVATGERSQLLRHFRLRPAGWPIAAITRQADVGDADSAGWLRADPAWVRAEMNGARLFAIGEGLHVTQADVDALLPALRPVFGDAGFALDAPVPSRWYLRLPRETHLPVFVDPDMALGADLLDYLTDPEADQALIRRWRALLNEVQVVLHAHPHNERRVASGRPPINSLWFWGGGLLPDHVTSESAVVQSDDSVLCAMTAASGSALSSLPSRFALPITDTLIDLRAARDLRLLAEDWLIPAIMALRDGGLGGVRLDFEDGSGYRLERRQRWRFWRRPLLALRSSAPAIVAGPA